MLLVIWLGVLRRSEKAKIQATLSAAREGNLVVRAAAKKAFLIYVARAAVDPDTEETALAEAGAIIEADRDWDVYCLRAVEQSGKPPPLRK